MIKNIFDVTIYSWIASESKRHNLRFTTKLILKIWRNSELFGMKNKLQSQIYFMKKNLILKIMEDSHQNVSTRRFKVLLQKSIHFCGCAGVRGDSKAKRKRRRWRNNIAEKILKKVFFQGWKNYTPVQFSIKKRAFKAATWLADTMTVVMAEVVVDTVEGKLHSFNQATPQNFCFVMFSMWFLHDLFHMKLYFSWKQLILKLTSDGFPDFFVCFSISQICWQTIFSSEKKFKIVKIIVELNKT